MEHIATATAANHHRHSCRSQIFSLWAESPRKNGGLRYTRDNVGVVLAVTERSCYI
ncbi:hypothetical protein ACSBR2_010264 [Camellia fascicularis]